MTSGFLSGQEFIPKLKFSLIETSDILNVFNCLEIIRSMRNRAYLDKLLV